MCTQSNFMRAHPLRESLDADDLKRIEQVMSNKVSLEYATVDELDAAYDIMYDYVAAQMQTHLGSIKLQ